MSLSRGKKFLGILVLTSLLWFSAFFCPWIAGDKSRLTTWLALPLVIIMLYGTYSLFVIGWGLFFFKECTEASNELNQEMKMAKESLRKKGIKIE